MLNLENCTTDDRQWTSKIYGKLAVGASKVEEWLRRKKGRDFDVNIKNPTGKHQTRQVMDWRTFWRKTTTKKEGKLATY